MRQMYGELVSKNEGMPAMTNMEKIEAAIDLAVCYGGIDGDYHKAWVIDQMVRALTGDQYGKVVAAARSGEDGPQTYDWNEGIAP